MHNGFNVTPLTRAGVFRRIAGKPAPENAFIEIRNTIAHAPLRAITAADTHAILDRYNWTIVAARPMLADIYRVALRHCAEDGELTADEKHFLHTLGVGLSLTDEQIADEKWKVLKDLFRGFVAEAVNDGRLTTPESERLKLIGHSFGLSHDSVKEIYDAEFTRVFQAMFAAAIEDRRITDDESAALKNTAENFGVTIVQDEKTTAAIARMRDLAQIESGRLPTVDSGLILQRGETCHAMAPASQHEMRTVTKRVNYSGLTSSVKIVGKLRWRVGSVAYDRVQKDVLTHLDTGTLHVTNRRLFFDGGKKNVSLPLKRIVSFTAFNDGVQLQKDSGRDQFFLGSATDWERLGAILDGVLRASRT